MLLLAAATLTYLAPLPLTIQLDKKKHINDLHATMLYLLGLDHEKLTYRYSGRDYRLTDLAGVVAKDVVA